jgi:hypothetical protein
MAKKTNSGNDILNTGISNANSKKVADDLNQVLADEVLL